MRTTRTILLTVVALLLVAGVSTAQMTSTLAGDKTSGSLPVGFGATFVGDKMYYLINLAPELAFGKFGVGLDLNLRFDQQGKFYADEFKSFNDFLHIIRYVRWAQKGDPFYVRFGQLDYASLGHGFIMYNYRNTASYDLRKTGIELDVDFDKFGFESVYSDFAASGIFGFRGYARPLKFTKAAGIPIIGGLETGISFATDMNKQADRLSGTADSSRNRSLSVIGFDLGLPLLSNALIRSTLYYDFANIMHYGHGSAVGIDLHLGGMGLVSFAAKYERRFTGDHFLPSYFNAMYERERYVPGGTSFLSKAMALQAAKGQQGYYGEMMLSILNTIRILGGYQAPVGVKNQGMFHAELETGNVIPAIVVGGGFDKTNIGKVFILDQNSVLYAKLGYKITPYLLFSTLYEWTWTERKDAAGNVIGYDTQRRVEPKLSLVINF